MLYRLFPALLLFSLTCHFQSSAQLEHQPPEADSLNQTVLRIGLVPGVQSHGINTQALFSFNLLGGRGGAVTRFEMGGLFNINELYTDGVQLAGLSNITRGYSDSYQFAGLFNVARLGASGGQFSGLANLSGGISQGLFFAGLGNLSKDDLQGIALSTVANLSGRDIQGMGYALGANMARGDIQGLFASGLYTGTGGSIEGLIASGLITRSQFGISGLVASGLANITGGEIEGLAAAGLLNYADAIRGLNAAAFNITNKFEGLQAGLFNYTGTGAGLQVGLINFGNYYEGLPIGLISYFRDNGRLESDLWINDAGFVNVGLKTGVDKAYNMISVGYNPTITDRDVWQVGLSLGINRSTDKLLIYEDYSFFRVNEGEWSGDTNNTFKFRYLVGKEVTDWFSFYAGPTLNMHVADKEFEQLSEDYALYTLWKTANSRHVYRFWVGLAFGVQLF